MSRIHCQKINDILSAISAKYGWADFSFDFIKSLDWSNPDGYYVREATPEMDIFLDEYKKSGITFINNFLLKSDLPKIYDPSDFGATGPGVKFGELFKARGWQSGIVYTTHGHGAVMGVIALQHRELKVDPGIIEATIDALNKWRGPFNDWARKLIDSRLPKNVEEHLSTREIDCMALVAEGKTSPEIADTLGITRRTVDFHINNSMLKLGCASRTQAAMMLFHSPLPHMSMMSKFEDS